MPAATALLAGGTVLHAQQTEGVTLDEVVVTAQKRSEDLQKVPISLQVLGNERLAQLQVSNFDDYAKFLPSVSFDTYGPGQAQLYFRGISSGGDGHHAGSLPATGVYLDEIPVTTIANSLDVHVYDIARVEALAGPQGTLYGASSLSGTLRIITNKPDPSKFSAGYDVKATKFGKGDGGGGFEGFVNIPLSDRAAVRLVGYYEHDGGYINNVPTQNTYLRPDYNLVTSPLTVNNASTVARNQNDVDEYGGRAALKLDLDDNWSITPMVIYQNQKANGDFTFDPRKGDLNVGDFRPGYNHDHWYQSALTVEGKISNFDVMYSGGWFERRVDNVVDYAEYTVAYDALAFVPGYQYAYTRLADAAGNLIDPTSYVRNVDKYTKMSHEIRITSPRDNRFRFVAGAFYQRQTDNFRAEYRVDGLAAANDPNLVPRSDVYLYGVDGEPNIYFLNQQMRVDRDYAVFGEGTYDLTDRLKVTAGIRKFWVNNTLYGFFGFQPYNSGEATCNPPVSPETIIPGLLPCINTDKKVVENGETHKVNLTYQVTPDHLIYGTYSTGFRPGGNNRRVEIVPYGSDRLTNLEFGWKTSWFDRRVRFNGALFYEKWKGVQIGVQGANGITSIMNIGEAKSRGIESDLSWAITDALMFTASGTYVNAKTSSNFCTAPNGVVTSDCVADSPVPDAPQLVAASGTQLPTTPRIKAAGTLRYRFNVGSLDSFLQGSIIHQGSKAYSIEVAKNAIVGPLPGFTTFDFSAGTGRGNWHVEAYIENAFDKRGVLGRLSECNDALNYCTANTRIYPIRPMNFGVKFGQKF